MPHRQDFLQIRAVMRIYGTYRLVLVGILVATFVLGTVQSVLGKTFPHLFALVSTSYLVFSALALLRHMTLNRPYSDTQLFTEFFIDIGCLMLMSYASSNSGLALLLVVCISAASMTLPGQLSLLIASLSTIAELGEVAANIAAQRTNSGQFVEAGMMGMAYFTAAFAIRYLSSRISTTQHLAERRREDIERLSQINQLIVQRMQTGIVVMSRLGHIKLLNNAAAELLDFADTATAQGRAAPSVLVEMARDPDNSSKMVTLGKSKVEVQVNMAHLDSVDDGDCLFYLENSSKIAQRAQNLKLASLGRFSASIAHEIRNPLAAISYAAQLLSENPNLEDTDRKFTGIIQNHANRMNDIIQNILELSRGRPPKPERFSMQSWLQDFADDWHSHHPNAAKIAIWASNSNIRVNVDPSQLQQIISNITENGLRHSATEEHSGQVRFVLTTSSLSGGAILDIIDSGPGIAAEDEDNIFEPFFTTQIQGSGLGLYLSRELCLANQMSIVYRRTDAGESCFRLQFSHPDRGTMI